MEGSKGFLKRSFRRSLIAGKPGSVRRTCSRAAAMKLSMYEASPMSLHMARRCAASWSEKLAGITPAKRNVTFV